jgi:hypothetical protein
VINTYPTAAVGFNTIASATLEVNRALEFCLSESLGCNGSMKSADYKRLFVERFGLDLETAGCKSGDRERLLQGIKLLQKGYEEATSALEWLIENEDLQFENRV